MQLEDKKKYNIAILASHPIQYQTPLYKVIAKQKEINLKVFFCSEKGLKPYKDFHFGKEIKWDISLVDGYDCEFLRNISLVPNLNSFWSLINPSIIKRIKDEHFDAVIITNWSKFSDWLGIFTAFLLKIPLLIRTESNLLVLSHFIKAQIKKIILSSFFKRVSAFLAIGTYNADFYRFYGVPDSKVFYVPYVVDNDFFISKANELLPLKEKLRSKFLIPVDLPVILFSGKLYEIKRLMDLLLAYLKVLTKIKASLVFVGDGILKNKLEEFVKKHSLQNVYFMGFRNQTEMPLFYALSDVLVLPSESETWGLVVNEAMCFKLPVVVSNMVGASGDIVKDSLNGYIFPKGNIEYLSDRLTLLLTDRTLREKMGNYSLEIIKNWSHSKCIEGLLDCLNYIEKTR